MQHVLALLRLGNHDSDVFYKFKQVLIDKVMFPYSTELVQMDVQGDIEKVCAASAAIYSRIILYCDTYCVLLRRVVSNCSAFTVEWYYGTGNHSVAFRDARGFP